MPREYVALDPRTGRPLNVDRGRRKNKSAKVESGPWMALPHQAVIPLAKGELESHRVSWKEKYHHLGQIDGIKALSILSGVLAHQGHQVLLECLMNDDPKIRCAGLFALPIVAETAAAECPF